MRNNNIFALLALFCSVHAMLAQWKGRVVDVQGNPLEEVIVEWLEHAQTTHTNAVGHFVMSGQPTEGTQLRLRKLGFQPKAVVVPMPLPAMWTITLEVEDIQLREVVIQKGENPALALVRKAIEKRKENGLMMRYYTADFYSKGIFRIKNAPKSLMGQKFDRFDEVLDSSRNGILYLSETVSKIKFRKPDWMDETIIASKVSGKDNGFSYNTARASVFDFYDNYIRLGSSIESPIADGALQHYKYKLEGSMMADQQFLVYKIKVTPTNPNSPLFAGYMYLVDDSYALYGVDVRVLGKNIGMPAVDELQLTQSFGYEPAQRCWLRQSQILDFKAGLLGINMSGRFTYVYSHYQFDQVLTPADFKAEVLRFEPNAQHKDSLYWKQIRPLALTEEEQTDYIKKDKWQAKKQAPTYLDSIDRVNNRFTWTAPLMGYDFQRSQRKQKWVYKSPLTGLRYNTVQGWHMPLTLQWTQRDSFDRSRYALQMESRYGFADNRWRPAVQWFHRYDRIHAAWYMVSGGVVARSFHPNSPIGTKVNSLSSLLFRDNYLKLYERRYLCASWHRELMNGLELEVQVDWSQRLPLYNHSSLSWARPNKDYTSNDPLQPADYSSAPIESHHLAVGQIALTWKPGQRYLSRPDGRFRFNSGRYPQLMAWYRKGGWGSNAQNNFDFAAAQLQYEHDLEGWGESAWQVEAGKYIHKNTLSWVDYTHFYGNQTHVSNNEWLGQYALLPYYALSTDQAYIQAHWTHNDNGLWLSRWPLIRQLNAQAVLGYRLLATADRLPYMEWNVGLRGLGFGKWKIVGLHYVWSQQGAQARQGVLIGLDVLDLLD